jgi:hypothetical protein
MEPQTDHFPEVYSSVYGEGGEFKAELVKLVELLCFPCTGNPPCTSISTFVFKEFSYDEKSPGRAKDICLYHAGLST